MENKMFFLLALLAGFVGGAICMALNGYKNLGTAADWVSGLGSVGAIVFAYKQINEQRDEYEDDKKERINREILANRPYFSIVEQTQLKNKKDHLWLTDKNCYSINPDEVFKKSTQSYTVFKDDFFAYKLKNVSQAVATDVVLKIEYLNEAKDKVLKTEYCNLRTCVGANEQAIILPHSIMNNPETYSFCPKKIYLYFKAIDDIAYCQRWTERLVTKNSLCAEHDGIDETPIEEMTSQAGYTRVYIPIEPIKDKDKNKDKNKDT